MESPHWNAPCLCGHPFHSHFKNGQGCVDCKCRQMVFDCRGPFIVFTPAERVIVATVLEPLAALLAR